MVPESIHLVLQRGDALAQARVIRRPSWVIRESKLTDTVIRHADVRRTLSERRRELQDEVQSRLLNGPTDRPKEAFALQIRTETLTRIDEALLRLDAGRYGFCLECESEIAERRLRALPFAVRCQACEEKRQVDDATRSLFAGLTPECVVRLPQ